MANKEIRELRKKAHELFDPLWQTGLMKRKEAYKKLAKFLDLKEAHISWLTKEQLMLVIAKHEEINVNK